MFNPHQFWFHKNSRQEKSIVMYGEILIIKPMRVIDRARVTYDIETTFLVKLVGGFIWHDDIMVFQ